MKKVELSIIIVSFNTKELLNKCLSSVYKSSIKNFEVIVVDNNSADGSVEIVKNSFPYVKIIRNSKNLYLTRAINQGIAVARGHFFLILNTDTELRPKTLEAMLSFLNNNPEIGLATCCHIDSRGKIDPICSQFPTPVIEFLDSTILGRELFKILKFKTIKNLLARYRYHRWNRQTSKEVAAIPASFLMGKMSIFKKIGNFNKNLLLFYQDIDYCKRARQAGYKVFYCADTSIAHLKAKSVSLLSPRLRSQVATHDMLAYHRKYSGKLAWLLLWFTTRVDLIYWSYAQ